MNESSIFGVSVRGILAFIIVASCCGLAIYVKEIGLLKDLAIMTVSFYFGQKSAVVASGNGNGTVIQNSVAAKPPVKKDAPVVAVAKIG